MIEANDLTVQKIEKEYEKGTENWGYDRKLHDDILSLIKLVPHASILEIGCGKGYLTKELTNICQDVTAIDISPTALEIARTQAPRAKFIQTDFESFISDKKYDVIICSEVLYYMKKRKWTLSKLKETGTYLVTSQFILTKWHIGFGSLIYEALLLQFSPIKDIVHFRLWPLNIVFRSLWKM